MGLFSVFSRKPASANSGRASTIRRSWAWVGSDGSDEIGIQLCPASSEVSPAVQDFPTADSLTGNGVVAAESKTTPAGKNDHAPQSWVSSTRSKPVGKGGLEPRSSAVDSRLSIRGSRRLAGFMTLVRSRRAQPPKIALGLLNTLEQADEGNARDEGQDGDGIRKTTHEKDECADTENKPQAGHLNINAKGNADIRKVSDQTVDSHISKCTNVTVHRHPSRRTLTPIMVVDREDLYENPFDDGLRTSESGSGSNPFTDPRQSMTTAPSSFDYSEVSLPMRRPADVIERPKNPMPRHYSFRSESSSSNSRSFSNNSTWSRQNQLDAVLEFKMLAAKLHLKSLDNENSRDVLDFGPEKEPSITMEERILRRRDRILGRMRSVRSTLQMRPSSTFDGRGLRRIKTHANLSRSDELKSLRGKSLEDLARLGGHSYLNLPGDFAPMRLKLPVCFVATAEYLKRHAPRARNVFSRPNGLKMAIRIYDHFASQVFSAERENDKIEVTMRRSTMPLDLPGMLGMGSPVKSTHRLLSVAWVFKCLLDGLPGGILGSTRLYQVLLEIYYTHIARYQLVGTDGCPEETSPTEYGRAKAIALAILASTSGMQLKLICAVFGLCATLLREASGGYEGRGSVRSNFWSGQNIEELSWVFGALLTPASESMNRDMYGVVKQEVENQRVAYMLIEHWHNISHQMRCWERGGSHPGKRATIRSSCGESRQTSESRSDGPGHELTDDLR